MSVDLWFVKLMSGNFQFKFPMVVDLWFMNSH